MMFLGVRIDELEAKDLVDRIDDAIRSKKRLTLSYYGFHTANFLSEKPESRRTFNLFSIVVPDGIAVIYASRLFGPQLSMSNRIGADQFGPVLFRHASASRWRVFLLGAAPTVVRTASERIRDRFPDLRVAGMHDGYFPPGSSQDVIDEINASGANLLLVGMGQPAQEEWIMRHAPAIHVPVIWAVGGYFDHLARRADCYPPIIYRLRLNWAYRLLTEPRRLWKRYLFGFPLYLMHLVAYAAGAGRRGTS
jgi:N-acetylglucosaminyldiphosphoundecaprenol N-acetyl-beta-D-mannosaminyltransferase